MKDDRLCKKFIKLFVKIGFTTAVLVLVISTVLYFCAGRIGDYYILKEISIELIHTSRKCAGVTALGGFLLDLTRERH